MYIFEEIIVRGVISKLLSSMREGIKKLKAKYNVQFLTLFTYINIYARKKYKKVRA